MTTARAHNPEIAQSLDDIADLLELDEANPFWVRAHRNAARVVRSLGTENSGVLSPGEGAPKLPGIGADLADKIRTLAATDLHCRMAKEAGVLVSIATDSHRAEELSYLRFGVGQARHGWLGKGDVLNSRSLAKLRPLIDRTMRR